MARLFHPILLAIVLGIVSFTLAVGLGSTSARQVAELGESPTPNAGIAPLSKCLPDTNQSTTPPSESLPPTESFAPTPTETSTATPLASASAGVPDDSETTTTIAASSLSSISPSVAPDPGTETLVAETELGPLASLVAATPTPTATPAPSTETGVIEPGISQTVRDTDGAISVTFDGDEAEETLQIEVVSSPPCDQRPDGRYIVAQFSLSAYAVDRADAEVKTFAAPVDLDVSLSAEQLMPFAPESLGLYNLNVDSGLWEEVVANADYANGTVSASLSHFSDYSIQAMPDIALASQARYFQVDMQSGAATANIPIELPNGPGGFTPSLSLLYSSSMVDEMKSDRSQGSMVGVGWNATIPSISRDPFAGRYYLSMAGVSDLLIREDDESTCAAGLSAPGGSDCFTWHTKNDQYLDIRSVRCNADGTADVYHQFLVHTKDGTEYQFGTNPGTPACPYSYPIDLTGHSEDPNTPSFPTTYPTSLQYFTKYVSGAWHRYHYRMDASQIKDVNGNIVEYKYFQDVRDDTFSTPYAKYVRAAYPLEIHWGRNGGLGHQYKATFALASDLPSGFYGDVRKDAAIDTNQTCFSSHTFESRYLDRIVVATETGTQIRVYNLGHTDLPSTYAGNCPISGNLKLDEIIVQGTDDSPLNTYSFDYQNHGVRYRQSNFTNCNAPNPDRPYLSLANNGFGAITTYTYVTSPSKMWAVPSGSNCGWERLIVNEQRTTPGASQPDEVYKLPSYAGMTYWSNPVTGGVADENAEFRGFTQVTKETWTGTTKVGFILCNYSIAGYTTGLPSDCTARDGSNNELTRTEYTYDSTTTTCTASCDAWEPGPVSSELEESRFVKLTRQQETGAKAGHETYRVGYAYGAYGNVSQKCEFTFTSSTPGCAASPYRQTSWGYTTPNASAYIVALPSLMNLYDASLTLASGSEFYYDQMALGATPSLGRLTKTRQIKTLPSTFVTTSQITNYDQFGNILSIQDGEGDTTAYTYACGNTVVGSSSLGGITTTYDYSESFIDPPSFAGCVFQRPERIRDSNGAINGPDRFTHYDVFGRTTKEWITPDSEGSPTSSYEYRWSVTGGRNGTVTTNKDGSSDGLWSADWTDGIGRTVQTRSEISTPLRNSSVSDTRYFADAAGSKIGNGTPYLKNVPAGTDPKDFTSPATPDETISTHDFLGRVVDVLNPDPGNTHRSTQYGQQSVTNVDERGNQVISHIDSFGRTWKVVEYDGASAYRQTVNGYNTLDLPTLVRLQNTSAVTLAQTTIAYDALGRKTSYAPPSASGAWTYTYFNDNQIKTQTDPRGITITFGDYDARGRLTSKSYSDGSQGITYFYDVGPNNYTNGSGMSTGAPLGRLTRVLDQVGEHLYSYDARGNILYERTALGTLSTNPSVPDFYDLTPISSPYYDVQRTYDSMNRDKTLTYPDGEQLAYTYDEQGLVKKLHSNTKNIDYVVSATFTANGQPKDVVLGTSNARTIRSTYRELNDMRLTGTEVVPSAGANLLDMEYDYDGAGNVIQVTDDLLPSSKDLNLGYDHLNRLEWMSGSLAATYIYDLMDNLKSKPSGLTGSTAPASFSGATAMQYSTSLPYRLTSATGTHAGMFLYDANFQYAFNYDANGNVVKISSSTDPELGPIVKFARSCPSDDCTNGGGYDAENRLELISYDKLNWSAFDINPNFDCVMNGQDSGQFSEPNGNTALGSEYYQNRLDLTMNGLVNGQDSGKLSPFWNRMSCLRYIYDYAGNLTRTLSGRFDANRILIAGLYEEDGEGDITKYYSANGQRIAMREDPTVGAEVLYFIASDNLGSASLVMDSTGNAVSRERYLPWGDRWHQGAAATNPTNKLFTGHMRETWRTDAVGNQQTTDFYHAGARFYSAQLGRFLSPDPVTPNYTEPKSLNPYAYVQNNPMRYTDPSGMCLVDMPRVAGSLRGCGLDKPAFVFVPAVPVGAAAGVVVLVVQSVVVGGAVCYAAVPGCDNAINNGLRLGVGAARTALKNTFFSDDDLGEEAIQGAISDAVDGHLDGELSKENLERGQGDEIRVIRSPNPATKAAEVFGRLVQGAEKIVDPTYDGEAYRFPDGRRIGLRVDRDGNPNIDIPRGSVGGFKEIKFLP